MKPARSYIICATPRSGSTLLCDLLADTKAAGRPDSFFRRQSFTEWARYFNVSVADCGDEHRFDQAYLAPAIREGTGGTDVFGMRLMWESVSDLSNGLNSLYPDLPGDSARFQAAFGPPVYVHLSRGDKIAQAVSRLKAEQTGLWHLAADGTERERLKAGHAPVYDSRSLADLVEELQAHDVAWATWFARQGIQPVSITYEALSNEPQDTIATVLSAIGLNPAIAKTVEPRTARLADSESHEWATRFRTERPNPSV